jgi:DNA polymerase I-like protein with 3'-5' exonuclease and polymerase domains
MVSVVSRNRPVADAYEIRVQQKIANGEVLIWNKYTGVVEKSRYGAKLYNLTTVAGRPLVVLDDLRQALSYQGQGSDADILVRAVANLPEHFRECFFLPVHDELVFEVPELKAEEYKPI